MSSKPNRFSGILKNTQTLAPLPEISSVGDAPRVGRPRGKKSNPDYQQVTVYLQKDIHRSAQKLLLDENQRKQFSELVNELVSEWVKNRIPDFQKSRPSEV